MRCNPVKNTPSQNAPKPITGRANEKKTMQGTRRRAKQSKPINATIKPNSLRNSSLFQTARRKQNTSSQNAPKPITGRANEKKTTQRTRRKTGKNKAAAHLSSDETTRQDTHPNRPIQVDEPAKPNPSHITFLNYPLK